MRTDYVQDRITKLQNLSDDVFDLATDMIFKQPEAYSDEQRRMVLPELWGAYRALRGAAVGFTESLRPEKERALARWLRSINVAPTAEEAAAASQA